MMGGNLDKLKIFSPRVKFLRENDLFTQLYERDTLLTA